MNKLDTLGTSETNNTGKRLETTKHRELVEDCEFDGVALQLLLLLDGLSIAQVKAVLRRAEFLAGTVTTFSIDSPMFREDEQAVQALLDGACESL